MIPNLQRLQLPRIIGQFLRVFLIYVFIVVNTPIFAEIYQIRNGDTLLIAVIGQPELTHSVQVRDDGRISYFGGDLQVSDKTSQEVHDVISEFLLSQKLVNNPVIMVSVVSQENTVFVGGAVNTPGRYSIYPESDIDLYRAIALAGGITENGDVQQVQVIRFITTIQKEDESQQNNTGDLTDKLTSSVETYDLSPNKSYSNIRVNSKDLVYVLPLSVIEVQGQVMVPGKLYIRKNISISNALARAGGFTEEADKDSLVMITKDGLLSEFNVSETFWEDPADNLMDISLSDGAVLFVPNAFKTEPIYVTGYVQSPGAQRVRGPLTLQKAIALAGGLDDVADRKKFHIHRQDGKTTEHQFELGSDTIILYPGDILEIHKRFQVNWVLVSSITSTAITLSYFLTTIFQN